MKKQKGVTLISLTIYVIALTIIVGILATISGFFYKNVDDTKEKTEPLTEFTNFNSFFIKEVEKTNIKLKNCEPDYIVFTDNNTSEDIRYIYIEHDKAIYRDTGEEDNDNKATFKVARGIERIQIGNPIFQEVQDNYAGKSKITVNLKCGEKVQTYTYTVNN